jgi:hypothetical protein
MTSLESRWQAIPPHPEASAFQRIDESHPLDFYLGKDASGEWLLLLVTSEQVAFSKENKAIHVFCRKRSDGKWALMFRLMKPELGRLFSLVCEDIVESSRNNPDPAHPASYVMARFGRWQRMLERGESGILDDAALRGLVGELLFLEKVAIHERGRQQAVRAWNGPTGADRDFCFPDCEFEIKTIREGADHILISSAEQLDLTSKPLFLSVVVLEDAVPGALPEVFTVVELVRRLEQILAPDTAASDLFQSRLMDAGFLIREEYSERGFILRRTRMFSVENGFPAIRRSTLPSGIGKVSWELYIQAILTFEVTSTR